MTKRYPSGRPQTHVFASVILTYQPFVNVSTACGRRLENNRITAIPDGAFTGYFDLSQL